MNTITRIATDVGWLPVSFTNVYFIGRPGGKWVLVDAGLPNRAQEIIDAAEARFGAGARPESIVLTHGHRDHSGSALELASTWGVPIYAHRFEIPFLIGKSLYPPSDPTVGGATAFLSRFLPRRTPNLQPYIRELETSKIPGASDWKWIATPGHSPGHVALFRNSDRVLLAGDAIITADMDSWSGLISGRHQLSRPPTPFTIDWPTAQSSVNEMAKLKPNVLGCGHGVPISDPSLPDQMNAFAANFRAPRRGRYARRPARADQNGIVDLPPAPFDPVPLATAAALLFLGVAIGSGYLDEDQR